MSFELSPMVGEWYRRLDQPQAFQVVALDEEAETVDIEYFDGTVDEWPLDHWYALDIERADAPADWTGAYDDVEADDLGASDTGMAPRDGREPFEVERGRAERQELASELRTRTPPRAAVKRGPARPHKARATPRH